MEAMKFAITTTSDERYLKFKTFHSFEELINFKKQVRNPLILLDFYTDRNGNIIKHPTLEIYDDYRE